MEREEEKKKTCRVVLFFTIWILLFVESLQHVYGFLCSVTWNTLNTHTHIIHTTHCTTQGLYIHVTLEHPIQKRSWSACLKISELSCRKHKLLHKHAGGIQKDTRSKHGPWTGSQCEAGLQRRHPGLSRSLRNARSCSHTRPRGCLTAGKGTTTESQHTHTHTSREVRRGYWGGAALQHTLCTAPRWRTALSARTRSSRPSCYANTSPGPDPEQPSQRAEWPEKNHHTQRNVCKPQVSCWRSGICSSTSLNIKQLIETLTYPIILMLKSQWRVWPLEWL